MVTDKLSIADFAVGTALWAWAFNPEFIAPQKYHDKAKEMVASSPEFCAWAERMKVEMKDYLANCPKAMC